MVRNVRMEKIEDITKCQMSFSKRCSCLIRKANEITDSCCEADVAFLAFCPSSSVIKYSSQRRIEDALHRYVNVPADKRLNHITNVQEKMEKLKQIDYIEGDSSKLHFLEKHSMSRLCDRGACWRGCQMVPLPQSPDRVENLELQIRTRGLQLQILEDGLRNYEQDPEQEPSLQQISWCERNLQRSLEIVMARKNELLGSSSSNQQPMFQNLDLMDQMEIENQGGMPLASNFNENGLTSAIQNPSSSQILKQLDPLTSPFSAQVRENMLQNLLGEEIFELDYNPRPSNISNFPVAGSSSLFGSGTALTPEAHFPSAACILQQQSSMANQSLLNFPDQNIDSLKNSSVVASSDGNNRLVQNPSNFMPPRFTSTTVINTSDAGKSVEMPQSQYYQTETEFEYAGLKLSNFASMQGDEIGQMLPNMDFSINFSNGRGGKGNENNDENEICTCNENKEEDKSESSYIVLPPEEVGQDELFGNLPTDQDIVADIWPLMTQKTGLWE